MPADLPEKRYHLIEKQPEKANSFSTLTLYRRLTPQRSSTAILIRKEILINKTATQAVGSTCSLPSASWNRQITPLFIGIERSRRRSIRGLEKDLSDVSSIHWRKDATVASHKINHKRKRRIEGYSQKNRHGDSALEITHKVIYLWRKTIIWCRSDAVLSEWKSSRRKSKRYSQGITAKRRN